MDRIPEPAAVRLLAFSSIPLIAPGVVCNEWMPASLFGPNRPIEARPIPSLDLTVGFRNDRAKHPGRTLSPSMHGHWNPTGNRGGSHAREFLAGQPWWEGVGAGAAPTAPPGAAR